MTSNPYAPPQAAAPAEPVGRKRWIAVLLAILAPPIAMLYVVRPLRAAAYLAAGILVVAGGMLGGIQGIADPALVLVAGSLGWRLVAAIEGFRLAPKWEGTRLPWYSRPPALVGFLAAGWLSIGAFRAFVIEPFRIPSGSMQPTLRIGDHILVDKRSYGWDLPLTARRVLRFDAPQRGDIAVFRYPPDPELKYVMRVVALPGETVASASRRLSIDGLEQRTTEEGSEVVTNAQGSHSTLLRYSEELGKVRHPILLDPTAPPFTPPGRDFPGRDQCRFQEGGFSCKVPPAHYFVMGDNRDNASDSRYWGFVPEDHFIGRTFFVWYSRDPDRAGSKVH